MRQVSPAAMASGSGIDPDDHFQEPLHGPGNGQRDNSNAATSPSHGDGPAEGGAGAPSPSPPPAAPVDRPQEGALQQAGSGSGGTNGSSSAAAGFDDNSNAATSSSDGDEAPSAVAAGDGAGAPSPSPGRPQGGASQQAGSGSRGTNGSSSAAAGAVDQKGSSPPTSSSDDSAWVATLDLDCKDVFDKLVQEGEKKKPEREQVKSSRPKKGFWSKSKCLFNCRKQIDDEGYQEHVAHQTVPITEVGRRYRATADKPVLLNLNAFSRIRPVLGDGECFYRSFIYSYLEQVLDRQDTHEEQRLLDTVKRVATERKNLGWGTCKFRRSYKWCKRYVTRPREFTDHLMMTALATALEVPLRLERLFGGGNDEDNIYSGPGVVGVTLLYTGNHYDIIYPNAPSAESSSRQASQGENPAG